MLMPLRHFFCICGILLTIGCSKTPPETTILYLSHTRISNVGTAFKLDPRIEALDFDYYDGLIHGGDVLWNTTASSALLDSVERQFNFAEANTIWVKGNHDLSDVVLLDSKYGTIPPVEVHQIGSALFFNTNPRIHGDIGTFTPLAEQLKTVDTATVRSVVVLTHHLDWIYGHPLMEGLDSTVSNAIFCDASWCLRPNSFMTTVYPELVQLQQAGVEVVCIAGDLGIHRKNFELTDNSGIHFLASGLNNEDPQDSVLILRQPEPNHPLQWEFIALDKVPKR